MSALLRAVLALSLLVAWRVWAVPPLLESWAQRRAEAPPASPGTGSDRQDHNWTAPLGDLLSPEERQRGAELARHLPPASPVPGTDPRLEPELLALTRVLLERGGLRSVMNPPEARSDEASDPWKGVEPRERLRLLRALVEVGALEPATEQALLGAALAHIATVQARGATN